MDSYPMSGGGKMSAAKRKEYEDQEKEWQAESDLRTLIEAEKVKADPDRMKRAIKKRDEMKKALTGIKKD